MSHRSNQPSSSGFTLLEVLVVITLLGIFTSAFFAAYNSSIYSFFDVQHTGAEFSTLAASSQRIADVLRGTTDFVSLGNNDVSLYSYFYPSDTYVSLIHYYLNAQNNILYADVTPMTANPPTGTPITAQEKTYTIIDTYYKVSGVNLFTYLDASGTALGLPVSDEHLVKGVQIILTVPGSQNVANSSQTMELTVSLRNRKTNL